MASDEWRKPVEPRIPQLCLTESSRRTLPWRRRWAGRFKVQSSKFKVGDAAVER